MIKVVQIYALEIPAVISAVKEIDNTHTLADVIFKDGRTYRLWAEIIEKTKLLAEYPTWQEAVNSKGFKE